MTKAYVINLESRPDRLKTFMNHTFVKWFDALEVVKAVDGASLVPDPNKVNPWNFRFLTQAKCKRVVACCMSHIMVWNQIVATDDGKDDFVVVFEDDAWPLLTDEEAFQTTFSTILNKKDISFLWLNSHDLYPKVLPKGSYTDQQVLRNIPHTCTTEAYAVRPSFAKKLIAAIENDMGAIDAHMARYLKSEGQNNGLLFPLFYQKYRNDTDIQVGF
jgi:GR25 family glycosyltransferase involved in LPS biosynthesis